MDESTNQGGVYGRREALKKAAVAGAVVWTAPLVMSSTAGATNPAGTCPDKVCVNTYFIRFDGSGGNCVASLGGAQGGNCTLTDLGLTTLPASGCAFVELKSAGTNQWEVYLAPGFTVLRTGVKAGSGCCSGTFSYTGECGTAPSGFEYGDVVKVNNCLTSGISNLSLVLCGP